MKKTGVIINPNAKKFRTHKALVDSYMAYKSDNIFIDVPDNLDELAKTASFYKNNNVDYICIGGGDGTIHLVLSVLINTYKPSHVPPILILKEGTMNNIARSIKLKGKGPDLFKKLLKKINNEEIIKTEDRFTIKVNEKYCFLFGTGLVTNFLNKVYNGTEKGFFRNIQVAFSGIIESVLNKSNGVIYNLSEQAIFLDEKKVLINPVAGILAGTVEHIGMGFSPLINAVQSNGTFQVIIIGMNSRGVLLNLNKIRTGKKIQSPKYFNSFGKTMLIRKKGSFEYTMDGDIYIAENELKITIGPSIKLLII